MKLKCSLRVIAGYQQEQLVLRLASRVHPQREGQRHLCLALDLELDVATVLQCLRLVQVQLEDAATGLHLHLWRIGQRRVREIRGLLLLLLYSQQLVVSLFA